MSDTDYRFDGLDEWERRLAQAIDRQYPEEFRRMVIDVAAQLEGLVKEKTPVDTGRLRNAWHIGEIKKRRNEYYIEVYNNVDYAEPVEYGHRKPGGGVVPGAHMMELSLQEVQKHLPGYLKEWMNDFINTHEL